MSAHDPEHRWTNDTNMLYWERRAKKAEAALREIVEDPAEVEMHGDCAYCQSKSIARAALEAQVAKDKTERKG